MHQSSAVIDTGVGEKGLHLTQSAHRWDRHILFLGVLLACETIIFFWIVFARIVEFFPPGFDQISYYLEAYGLIEKARSEGWLVLVKEYTEPRHATGIFTVQGALLGLLFGSN